MPSNAYDTVPASTASPTSSTPLLIGGATCSRVHTAVKIAPDCMGLFAVTAGHGVQKKEAQFLADRDDYSAIMLKALADRLAEAFAEWLHQRVRTDLWGYAEGESPGIEDLIADWARRMGMEEGEAGVGGAELREPRPPRGGIPARRGAGPGIGTTASLSSPISHSR